MNEAFTLLTFALACFGITSFFAFYVYIGVYGIQKKITMHIVLGYSALNWSPAGIGILVSKPEAILGQTLDANFFLLMFLVCPILSVTAIGIFHLYSWRKQRRQALEA